MAYQKCDRLIGLKDSVSQNRKIIKQCSAANDVKNKKE